MLEPRPDVAASSRELPPLKDIPVVKVIELAKEAGDLIKVAYHKGTDLEFKSGRQVVTAVDLQSEELLKKGLSEIYPCSFFGEEGGGTLAREGDQWVVDPLDGTENMDGYPPAVAVSIGLIRNGEPVVGVIYDLLQDIVYSAKQGEGAFINGKPIQLHHLEDITNAKVGFDFSSWPETRSRTASQLTKTLETVRTVKVVGAPSLSIAAVATGKLDLFVRPATKPHDLLAGVVIAKEAGVKVADEQGKDWNIDSSEIVVGSPKLVETFRQLTEKETSSLGRPDKLSTNELIKNPQSFSWLEVLPKLLQEKARGKTIVVTNGHFALFHPGHSVSLEQAREIGSLQREDRQDNSVVVIVIVNADHQTTSKDPVKASAQTAQERALVVYDNRHSDYVVISEAQEGDQSVVTDIEKMAAAGIIDPGFVYIKGGDYDREQKVPQEAQMVKAYGGNFAIVSRKGNYSTTSQLLRMLKARET